MNEHKRETRREEAGKQKQIKQFLKVGLSLKKTKITSVKNTALENNEETKKFQFIPHKREN